jgi:catechol 2,3-dioxygenase-like lactoylglutathione lyase family enzyme
MKNTICFLAGIATTCCVGFTINTFVVKKNKPINIENNQKAYPSNNLTPLKLGAFSISLSVKDLAKSKAFYENLGFTVFGGAMEKRYLIMKNETTLIGIFQGMFQGNMLTFNPGWDSNAKNVEPFDDIRIIQKELKSKNIALTMEADEKTTGPASVMTTDPDGNIILIDQHR